MELPDFTVENLKQLPLRAIVAFAARCARRVEPLAQLPEGHPDRERCRGAIDAAIGAAEGFARGEDAPVEPSVIEAIDGIRNLSGDESSGPSAAVTAAAEAAHAASLARQAVEVRGLESYKPPEGRAPERTAMLDDLESTQVHLAAVDAYTAAAAAYRSVGFGNEGFVAASLNDYDQLVLLKLGRYPEPGKPIDPSPGGPLGRL